MSPQRSRVADYIRSPSPAMSRHGSTQVCLLVNHICVSQACAATKASAAAAIHNTLPLPSRQSPAYCVSGLLCSDAVNPRLRFVVQCVNQGLTLLFEHHTVAWMLYTFMQKQHAACEPTGAYCRCCLQLTLTWQPGITSSYQHATVASLLPCLRPVSLSLTQTASPSQLHY